MDLSFVLIKLSLFPCIYTGSSNCKCLLKTSIVWHQTGLGWLCNLTWLTLHPSCYT